MKAAIYARVSTLDQQPENQLAELRRYVAAHGWDAAIEYVDHGVSGAKEAIRQNLFSAGLEPSRRAVPSRIGSTANANSRTSHFSEPSYCEAYRNLRVISSESAAPPAATPSTSAEAAGLRRRALALLSEFVSEFAQAHVEAGIKCSRPSATRSLCLAAHGHARGTIAPVGEARGTRSHDSCRSQ